jgi:hypothetical protein
MTNETFGELMNHARRYERLGNLEKAYFAWSYPNKIKEAKQEGERKATQNLQEKKAVLSINSKSKRNVKISTRN